MSAVCEAVSSAPHRRCFLTATLRDRSHDPSPLTDEETKAPTKQLNILPQAICLEMRGTEIKTQAARSLDMGSQPYWAPSTQKEHGDVCNSPLCAVCHPSRGSHVPYLRTPACRLLSWGVPGPLRSEPPLGAHQLSPHGCAEADKGMILPALLGGPESVMVEKVEKVRTEG